MSNFGDTHNHKLPSAPRRFIVVLFLLCLPAILLVRAASLQWLDGATVDHNFLQREVSSYSTRIVERLAHRGSLLDREGMPLAMSVPLTSLWADPKLLRASPRASQLELAQALEISVAKIDQMLDQYADKRFMYLRRHLPPDVARKVLDKKIPGVRAQNEYQRYYPNGEVSAPLLGVTGIDDQGQEGLELAYNKWLSGVASVERVRQDRRGDTIRNLGEITIGRDGSDLQLSLDSAIQYAAYRALQETVLNHDAKAGAVVVLDTRNAEILAVANYPAPNPHQLDAERIAWLRNRAAMDLIEPGSLIKPFVVASALESGAYKPTDVVDTAPGCVHVSGKDICDPHDRGALTLGEILRYSSQVGIVRLALNLDADMMLNLLSRVGIGAPMNLSLPVDPRGHLPASLNGSSLARMSVSYGYGLSGTLLQWARAYSVIANEGRFCTPSLVLRAPTQKLSCRQALKPSVAQALMSMLTDVVSEEGTGGNAHVLGYKVAGKTATIRKYNSERGLYTGEEHIAAFVGIAPVTDPRVVVAVYIDEPRFYYYGGMVAAPLFSKVAAVSLRRLNATPDNLQQDEDRAVLAENARL